MNLAFAAHDPGGANAIRPIILQAIAQGLSPRLFATGPAVSMWAGLPGLIESEDSASPSECFDGKVPDVVITGTSMMSDFEQRFWNLDDVVSTAVLDSWVNLKIRFEHHTTGALVLPDAIGVIDEQSRLELSSQDWCTAELMVVGQLHLEQQIRELKEKWEVRERSSELRAVFFSEPVEADEAVTGVRGYNKFDIFHSVLKNLPVEQDIRMFVKLHPRESRTEWDRFVADLKYPRDLKLSFVTDSAEDVLLGADYVIGMATMVLLEAAGVGIPVASIEPDRIRTCNPGIDANKDIYKAHSYAEIASTLDALFQSKPKKPKQASRLNIEAITGQILNQLEDAVQQKRR
ncbi:MAG: hypothetical protein OQK24_01510 [Magnetovibrio sp.]|nr:hypothetical protein [Magnetovibrio sp.]